MGNYDARKGHDSVMNAERVTYWMSQGAQVSNTVHNMLVEKKVISGKKVNNLPLKKAIKKDAPATEAVAPKAEAISAPEEASVVAEAVEETPAAEAVA